MHSLKCPKTPKITHYVAEKKILQDAHFDVNQSILKTNFMHSRQHPLIFLIQTHNMYLC